VPAAHDRTPFLLMSESLFSAVPLFEILARAVCLFHTLISFHSREFQNAMRWKALVIPTITDCSFKAPASAAYPLRFHRSSADSLTRSVFQCHRKLMLIAFNPFHHHPHLRRLSIQVSLKAKANMRRTCQEDRPLIVQMRHPCTLVVGDPPTLPLIV